MNENLFTQNIKKDLKEIIKNYSSDKIFILTDKNTSHHCYSLIKNSFVKEPILIEVSAGDKNKNLQTSVFIWNFLSEHKADRKSLMINIGGGFITDLGGFIASTYQRGIDFINIPTTLLAQVDAAIGGKNGINLNDLKNQIGTFNYPKLNIISTDFLKTLPKRDFIAGFAEVIKHALIYSEDEWNKISIKNPQTIDADSIKKIVKRSVDIKISFIKADPQEKGIREALNFGHTIGHAVETFFTRKNIDIMHGEAVAIGLIAELYLSNKILTFSFKKLFEITEYISKYFPVFSLDYSDYEEVYQIMKHDKKNKENKIRFSLLKDIGKVEVNQTCKKEEIFEALNFYFQMKK